MAMAGSAASRALERANDHLAMLITALIPQRRSRRAAPYGFCDDCRCTDSPPVINDSAQR